jgi:Zn-dependent protease with chaperone function
MAHIASLLHALPLPASTTDAIVQAARDYVKDQLQAAMDDCKAKLPPDISQEHLIMAYQRDETVQEWHQARLRLEGEYGDKTWQYIFIQTKMPNAFVTEILPQRFFITSSMLQIAETSDELAVVLGHEGRCWMDHTTTQDILCPCSSHQPTFSLPNVSSTVSHLLLGHVANTNSVEMILRTMEVLLLTIDPTAGAFSVAVMAMLASLRHAMSTAYSRENEYEADRIGLQIAARACFDTNRGVDVIRKMHDFKVAAQPNVQSSRVSQVYDTHPPTLDRFDRLVEAAKIENYKKYKQCANKRRLTRRLSCRPEGRGSLAWRFFWTPTM